MAIKNPNEGSDEIMAEINMTPLIDIMLVLLILFMVTSSVALESGLDIDLPKTAGATKQTGPEAVIVSVDKTGGLSVQGERTTSENLEAAIKRSLNDTKKSLVILEGDKQATLGKAIEIMDTAKAAGAKKFAIATQKQ